MRRVSSPASGRKVSTRISSSWVAAHCDSYRDEIPPIPDSLILATSAVYIEAFETITGQSFTLPDAAGDVLERVRRNLAGPGL
jgi:phosphoribosylaminoimidazole-succinocarboxamide synthase